ncbi:MAG: ammonium transporter, partial [Deltaproteobacteria bacterium]
FSVTSVIMGALTYPLFANWAWGGGWLSQLGTNLGLGKGYADFAGSGVVHSVGGLTALAVCLIVGPRIGKFNRDGSANPIIGHDISAVLIGCFILAFGWFGFNPGSTLGASANGTMSGNGLLAGLVAITAPSGFVSAPSAAIIGLVAGVLVCVSVSFIENVLKVDDPVGAISVHGANGLWGVLSVGLFADGTSNYGGSWNGVTGSVTGLFYGDPSQLAAQLVGISTLVGLVFTLSFAINMVLEYVIGHRVSAETELNGLDIPEMGQLGYPEFVFRPEPTFAAAA